LAVSPDGKQIAVGAGLASGSLGIWIKELDHGPFTRLTFGGLDRRPAWSPDGQTVAFIRDTVGGSSVFARRADGSTAEKALARFDRAAQEVTWSPDGQWILVRTDNGAAGAGDIVGVRTTGDTTKVSLVASEFTELHPAISPDGHWLAYTSNESGINEVFVRPFPGVNAGRWQVSTGGGEQPRWSPDGKELFYMNLDTGHFTAAGLRLSPRFEVVDRRVLFTAPPFDIDPYHTSFDVLPNGRGFLFMLPRAMTQLNQTSLVQAENWFEDLRIRLKR
jgi:serine/threonine-protein kinase